MRRLVALGAIAAVGAGVAAAVHGRSGRATRAELRHDAGPPPTALAELIDRADKIVVREEPFEASKVLFESNQRRDLDEFKAALLVNVPDKPLHCMCDGSPAVFLYAKGEIIGRVTNHHGELIRCSLWESDTRLTDAEPFLRWFDARGIGGPREEVMASAANRRKWRSDEDRWIAAMPAALKPHWKELKDMDADAARFNRILADAIPDPKLRIQSLFGWFGSHSGTWSPFPSYEAVPENMLLMFPSNELASAVEDDSLSKPQLEGAARLFAGWSFGQHRPQDVLKLAPATRARLLKHSLENADEDKRSRSQAAFGTK